MTGHHIHRERGATDHRTHRRRRPPRPERRRGDGDLAALTS
ncbi:hypothetical protein KCH_34580 [Kitasatospora cheerisanensis KCTC 2395]|uniref:Uncharacterized protein n=1 Tax=Kitasatospora cheerisanensis KCTC 2395 TaxID=1348663 RepID=A0A066Z3J7_9ACTN|nr:hypothetical protein KCH_34580 [Kitasatospora cheerisanensis KCTC 2395]